MVAEKVEATLDPADERLVWVFSSPSMPSIWLTTFTAPRNCQRITGQRNQPAFEAETAHEPFAMGRLHAVLNEYGSFVHSISTIGRP